MLLRQPVRYIRRREKAGVMSSDDFLGGVTLVALRAAVPGQHVTVGVEHIDGIILNCIDQFAEQSAQHTGITCPGYRLIHSGGLPLNLRC
jgi:hypothetical protein